MAEETKESRSSDIGMVLPPLELPLSFKLCLCLLFFMVAAICIMHCTLLGKECTTFLLLFFFKEDSDGLYQLNLEHPFCIPIHNGVHLIWLPPNKIWEWNSESFPMRTTGNKIRKKHFYLSIPCIKYLKSTEFELRIYSICPDLPLIVILYSAAILPRISFKKSIMDFRALYWHFNLFVWYILIKPFSASC